MRRAITAAIAATLLAGCTLPVQLEVPGTAAPTALDRADNAFARLQRAADTVLPLLPIERQVRARAVMAAIAIALGAARSAKVPDEHEAALATIDEQVAALARILRR